MGVFPLNMVAHFFQPRSQSQTELREHGALISLGMGGHFAVKIDQADYFRRVLAPPASHRFRAKCRVDIDLNGGQRPMR